MTLPVYTGEDSDKGNQLVKLMGTFWRDKFSDKQILKQLMKGRSILFDQAINDLQETQDTVSRQKVPPFHTEIWTPLYFYLSKQTDDAILPLRYGPDKALYGVPADNMPYNHVFVYGESMADANNSAVPVSGIVHRIRILCNRINDPSLVLIEGVDFKVDHDNNVLVLPLNVFTDSRISVRTISNGTTDDTEALLWAFTMEIDLDTLWNYFGVVLNIDTASSDRYRDYINAVWNMHTDGSMIRGVTDMLSAALDVPVTLEDQETVELILYGQFMHVVTDQHVYQFDKDSTVIVAVNDVLAKGSRLVDTFNVIEPFHLDDGFRGYSLLPVPKTVTLEDVNWDPDRTAPILKNTGTWTNPYTEAEWAVKYPGKTFPTEAVYTSTASSDTFRGFFANESTKITTGILAAHDFISLDFDLLVIGGWRGNTSGITWELLVDGVSVIDTNFSNDSSDTQAYPDTTGVGYNTMQTGALEPRGTDPWLIHMSARKTSSGPLGWTAQPSSKYHLSFMVCHDRPAATIEFQVSGLLTGAWCVMLPSAVEYAYQWKGIYSDAQFKAAFEFNPNELFDASYETERGANPQLDLLWYPQACWGLQNMVVQTVSATREKLPYRPSQPLSDPTMAGMSLDSRFLNGAYFSGLYFPNKLVTPEYMGLDVDGRAEVHFEVTGFPADVDLFWENVQANGKKQGYTLANYLDMRAQPHGEPTAADMPSKVNPMMLVLRQIMGYNLLIIKVRRSFAGPGALPASLLSSFRDTLPPHVAALIFVEVTVDDEEITDPIGTEGHVGHGPWWAENVNVSLIENAPIVQALDGVLI